MLHPGPIQGLVEAKKCRSFDCASRDETARGSAQDDNLYRSYSNYEIAIKAGVLREEPQVLRLHPLAMRLREVAQDDTFISGPSTMKGLYKSKSAPSVNERGFRARNER